MRIFSLGFELKFFQKKFLVNPFHYSREFLQKFENFYLKLFCTILNKENISFTVSLGSSRSATPAFSSPTGQPSISPCVNQSPIPGSIGLNQNNVFMPIANPAQTIHQPMISPSIRWKSSPTPQNYYIQYNNDSHVIKPEPNRMIRPNRPTGPNSIGTSVIRISPVGQQQQQPPQQPQQQQHGSWSCNQEQQQLQQQQLQPQQQQQQSIILQNALTSSHYMEPEIRANRIIIPNNEREEQQPQQQQQSTFEYVQAKNQQPQQMLASQLFAVEHPTDKNCLVITPTVNKTTFQPEEKYRQNMIEQYAAIQINPQQLLQPQQLLKTPSSPGNNHQQQHTAVNYSEQKIIQPVQHTHSQYQVEIK